MIVLDNITYVYTCTCIRYLFTRLWRYNSSDFFSFYIFNIVFKLLNNFSLLNLGKFMFEIVHFSKINFGWIGQSIVYNTINISINSFPRNELILNKYKTFGVFPYYDTQA